MIVRRVRLDDLPQLVPLMVEAHRAYRMQIPYTRSLKQFTEAMGNVATITLVADLMDLNQPVPEKKLVGFVWGEVQETGDFFIHHVYGRGRIGPQLWEAIEKEAKAAGCRRVTGLTSRPMGFVHKYGARIQQYFVVKEI